MYVCMLVCLFVRMQRWRENYPIHLHQILHKHMNWASINAREGLWKIFQINPSLGRKIKKIGSLMSTYTFF